MKNHNVQFKMSALSIMTVLMFATLGCKKTGDSGGASGELVSSLDCESASFASAKTSTLQGRETANPGEAISYKIEGADPCVSQKFVWANPSGQVLGVSSKLGAEYSRSGEYVVTAKVSEPQDPSVVTELNMKTLVSDKFAISGPQIGMVGFSNRFELNVPAGASVVSVAWNFGDTFGVRSGVGPVDYTYSAEGKYRITVTVNLTGGETQLVMFPIQILPTFEGLECINQMAISGPSLLGVSASGDFSVFLPTCLAWRVQELTWQYGDGQSAAGANVSHSYEAVGNYEITLDVTLSLDLAGNTTVRLTLPVTVVPPEEDPGPNPEPDPQTDPTVPADPLACPTLGETRTSTTADYSETRSCGVAGSKDVTFRDRVTERCDLIGEVQKWHEVERTKEQIQESECRGQACALPAEAFTGVDAGVITGFLLIDGKYYLADGQTKKFFSQTLPAASCADFASDRTCSNGTLSESDSYVYLLCQNGCPGVGPHGSINTGVVVGSQTQPKICPFGETGVSDTYQTLADQVCTNGQVATSNVRIGSLVEAGLCPGYTWTGTDRFSACTQACGGEQAQEFECRDSLGNAVASGRCEGAAPVVTRLCDGDPESVRRSETETTREDANSCQACPKNQIGIVTKERDVTVKTTYACINHEVAVENRTETYGAWIEESYCRDFVPKRCSQDSLTNSLAEFRYRWMVKCRSQVPAIDQFLTAFAENDNGKGLFYSTGRQMYATFMDKSKKPEKAWIAPKTESASCNVPKGVYVAAVCLASCATPEEQILASEKQNKTGYVRFDEAWQNNLPFVATLSRTSSMTSKKVHSSKVDVWVTEMMDTDHTLVEFQMKSGQILKLTPNHPILTETGEMKLAGEFKVGENLVRLGGELDPIVRLNEIQYFGKVYNVFVKSNAPQHNIVVTNGYLNGTAFFQNEGAKYLNRKLFRDRLISGALDEGR